ncbi:hypothetical protein D3C81_376530 [compost metagenome]
MDQTKIPPEHAGEVLAFLQARTTAELVDLIELATHVMARGQTVYNFQIPGSRMKTQTFYDSDVHVMFEELRRRLPVDEEAFPEKHVVETPSITRMFHDHPQQAKAAENWYTTVLPKLDKEH